MVVKKGWKICSRFSGAIPVPSSETVISPKSPTRRPSIERVPPKGMASRALSTRFTKTCLSSAAFARTGNVCEMDDTSR